MASTAFGRDGNVTLLTKEMTFPNGIALSPDEKTLYVANSDPKRRSGWPSRQGRRHARQGPGLLRRDRSGRPEERPSRRHEGRRAGNLFATGPGGVLVFAPDGTHLGTLATGEATANCGWGDDGSTLYITADMYLCRIRLTTKGRGF